MVAVGPKMKWAGDGHPPSLNQIRSAIVGEGISAQAVDVTFWQIAAPAITAREFTSARMIAGPALLGYFGASACGAKSAIKAALRN